MSEERRFVRRNRVNERTAVLIASLAAAVAVFSGAEPTGSPATDLMLVGLSAGFVTWAAASAPWWAPAAASGIGAAIALDPLVATIGAIGFVAGLVVGVRRRDLSELRAIGGAIAVNVLLRSGLDVFHGLSAIIGITTCLGLVVLGIRRRPSAIRRGTYIATAVVGAIALVGVASAALSGVTARNDLSAGARYARQAISTLNSGDYRLAAQQFADSSRAFDRASGRLGGFLAAPSALVPGIAQNLDAASDLADAAADGTAQAASALDSIDPSTLRVVDGAIDLEAVGNVEEPLRDVQRTLEHLQRVAADVRSPWLIGRLQDELGELDAELAENEPRLANAVDAVTLAPQLLGADGERRYMVMFTSPVEARGVAGFMGNYAIARITDGRITLDDFGRRSDLEAGVGPQGASCAECPDEMVENLGRFGISDAAGTFHQRGWSSITLPAHFPDVARAAQVVLPQSGGPHIDGVIAMDPYVVQALMQYTGPIELTEADVTVAPANAARFLLADQYSLIEDGDNVARLETIDTLGQQVIGTLLSTTLPEPSTLARELGPLVAERRLLVWTDDAAERELLSRVGLLGELPGLGDDGGFSVVVSNGGHSKIDYFLDREVAVDVVTADSGERTLVADVTLTNNAPAAGLPRYVIGNSYGLPSGTSRLWVRFYGPDGIPEVTVDGEPATVDGPRSEAGWWFTERYDDLGPGESVTYRVEYALGPDADGRPDTSLWVQPLAQRG